MKKLIFILGASGSGKTSNVRNIESKYQDKYHFAYFDQLGVPPEKEVIEKYGGWEKWGLQRLKELIEKIKKDYIQNRVTIFDVQNKPENIEDVCKEFGISNYVVILLDCSDEERKNRLVQRNQSHLITDSLITWAQFLRDESTHRGYTIIDNTGLTVEEGFKKVEERVKEISSK